MARIEACPIPDCGGELQTQEDRTVYYNCDFWDLEPDGSMEDYEEHWEADDNYRDRQFYCSNDHTVGQMLPYLTFEEAEPEPTSPTHEGWS